MRPYGVFYTFWNVSNWIYHKYMTTITYDMNTIIMLATYLFTTRLVNIIYHSSKFRRRHSFSQVKHAQQVGFINLHLNESRYVEQLWVSAHSWPSALRDLHPWESPTLLLPPSTFLLSPSPTNSPLLLLCRIFLVSQLWSHLCCSHLLNFPLWEFTLKGWQLQIMVVLVSFTYYY